MAVRITGGVLCGRLVTVSCRAVRPTQDKVRAALFSSLAEAIPGARVLDLFAGSGALGLEAVSRGAAGVCWVEADRRVFETLQANIRRLCGIPPAELHSRPSATIGSTQIQIVRNDVLRFLARPAAGDAFNVIFADPPYDQAGIWLKKLLSALASNSILADKGLLVMEQSARAPVASAAGWGLLKVRVYGETQVCIYRKEGGKST